MAVMLVTVLNSTWKHVPHMLHDTEGPLLFRQHSFAVQHGSVAVKAESGMMERFCSPSGELHSTEHQQQRKLL